MFTVYDIIAQKEIIYAVEWQSEEWIFLLLLNSCENRENFQTPQIF